MIDLYTVRYVDQVTDARETVTVYAYPSGGVGITTTDPVLADALGGVHQLVYGITPEEADILAQRMADVFAYLTGGDVSHDGITHEDD